jgi:ketosteroid isomerase-like protein
MSRENVEIVRRVFEATNRRDTEAARSLMDPEIEWDTSAFPFPDLAGVCRGSGEVLDWWRRWMAAWDEVQFEIGELIEAGDDVVVGTRAWGRGRDGVEVEVRFFNVYTVRGRKLAGLRTFRERTHALEAAGLSE